MTALSAAPSVEPVTTPSFVLLTRVELRKAVDTRAGRVLLAVTLLLSLLVLGYEVLRGRVENLDYGQYVQGAVFPVVALLPVVGVLAMASEWTQRTVLTTLTFTPRRLRVLMAKLAAAVVLGVVVTALVEALAALALVLRALLLGHTATWGNLGTALGGSMVSAGLALVMGAALGALLMQTALAIVTYFVAPNLLLLGVSALASDKADWVDVTSAFGRLTQFDVSGHVGPTITALALWIALPLVLGVLRSLRRNVS
jgi:ABC-type transport system involved in multi-copper enzyme maturation permease subunit